MMVLASGSSRAEDVDPRVRSAEAQRIAVIEKVKPTVVAVFAPQGQGGGSGVLISPDGFALTNFHVVASMGATMHCGLADGVLYDAVLVGLDKVGDVALIKLLPKKEGQPFPFAPLGDSDQVRVGDWALAMGNPFLLATDFTPTVTYGLVSGVHRYQYPESSRGLLEYTDCIQTDTSINPGNSGGPLFNLAGEVIGINGRISLEKRGRVNSGVGYAISINQIKNFLGHLKAGLDTDHATLGATVRTASDDDEEGTNSRMVIDTILEESDAFRRGLEPGDEIVSFAGRPVTTVNQYKNVLGIFPKGWRVPLVYRRNNDKKEILVRLMGVQRQQLDGMSRLLPRPQPPQPQPQGPSKPSPALKFFEAKPGFANYYFNRQERDRLLASFRRQGDFSGLTGDWTLDCEAEIKQRKTEARLAVREEKSLEEKTARTISSLSLSGVRYELDPLLDGQDVRNLKDPPGSGGLLLALYQYRRLLVLGEKGFEGGFSHGGHEPFYPPPADMAQPVSLKDLRVDTEVLLTEHAGIPVKWYFSLSDQRLLGFEVKTEANDDPCEVYLSDYRPVDDRQLPHRIDVLYANGRFGTFMVKKYNLSSTQ